MESILKQVYGVELASQKVELGVMQDMQKYTNILNTQVKELSNVMSQLKSIATDAYNSPAKALQLLDKSIKEFEKDATGLGLKPSEFSSYNEAVSLTKSVNSELDKFYSRVLKNLNK